MNYKIDEYADAYPDGVGELSLEHQGALEIIQKEENYRCSKAVIDVLNKVRTDIKQVPSGENVEGAAVYVGLVGLDPESDVTSAALAKAKDELGIETKGEVKVLFLTHRLIARKAGYEARRWSYSGLDCPFSDPAIREAARKPWTGDHQRGRPSKDEQIDEHAATALAAHEHVFRVTSIH